MLKNKKTITLICTAILAVAIINGQTVNAAISKTLSIFRAQDLKGVTVTIDDIQQIQSKLSSGQGEISLEKMGNIKVQGGQKKVSSKEDVKSITDVTVAFPSVLDGVVPSVNVVEPTAIEFTLKAENVNEIMKSYGATKLLPANIDGKTFKIDFASQVTMNYSINNKPITIMETKSPEITVPDDVDIDAVYDAVVEMPIIPQRLQSQLKSMKDWKSTLYIPVIESEMTEVNINGAKGYMSKDYGNSEENSESAVIWYDKGIIYVVSGQVDSEELLKIAKSVK
ncbi:DUF4367 domain-containing protein [Clostridium intestinale]|uniref:DUF4367 domain-containing protein n=1 Tax=Clostridium intestinale DSM 6191 TaxID=1121320 RepID=A0A1M6B8T1_9CLOT|nr:DUF4367 domain-containing protein [Clostridium intestinale]SHI45106.1 protein of unknown function [Clostridium intestinale DSM 6191]